MMAENPNWWSMMNGMMHLHESNSDEQQFVYNAAADSPLSNSNTTVAADHHHPTNTQDFPVIRSWSQLLLGGLADGGEEEEEGGGGEKLFGNYSVFQQQSKLENSNWEEQVLLTNLQNPSHFNRIINNNNNYYNNHVVHDVKQEEISQSTNNGGGCQLYDNENDSEILLSNSSWPHHHHHHHEPPPVSNFNSNSFFNISGGKAAAEGKKINNVHRHNQDYYSSECNSSRSSNNNGGVSKKARVHQSSSAQPALKVRKEKLMDRITALHQLVSPFGKTDQASVLSEAIGYIRFLHAQIQALSFPYMRNASSSVNNSTRHHHQHSDSEMSQGAKDLRSRGLCLVPISCTENVGNNDNGADYWAPSAIGGGF